MTTDAIKLGLYGCGNRTRALLDAAEGEENYEVAACYDIVKAAAEDLCSKYGGKVCETSADLVACEEVDAFLISLDPFAHPKAFYETLEAGKPIFIEKPIAMEADEAYKMMMAAEEKGVNVQVGFMRRYNPGVQAALEYIKENDPGEIFSVNGRWFHAGETELINMLNNSPDNFRLKVSQIPFHCCHMLDVMRLLGGEQKNVYSRGLKVVNRIYPSPDEVISTIEFDNGTMGLFHYCSFAYSGAIDYVVHTENYTLEIWARKLVVSSRPKHKHLRDDGSKDCRPLYHKNIGPDIFEFKTSTEDFQIMTSFLKCVRSGEKMTPTLENAWKVTDLAEGIENSYKQDKKLDFPVSGK
ncbi:MAG: Gfo/Idh/MocA family protein [Planctomycetota bacterium]|jgi:predicted dehydrogenase